MTCPRCGYDKAVALFTGIACDKCDEVNSEKTNEQKLANVSKARIEIYINGKKYYLPCD